ncbi:MAG TPA: helix-turn-helix transcriptional regulator [Acidimicrobiales bacterium]|nr:helix-turn-helix transcriptional regulator [Acidimicrobiales bacterium]
MTAKLDYRWHLRQVMARQEMFSTTDLSAPLSARGIKLSPSQVYRLVVERPERLSLKVLMALLDISGCSMEELIEPVALQAPAKKARAAACHGPPALPWTCTHVVLPALVRFGPPHRCLKSTGLATNLAAKTTVVCTRRA